MPRRPPPEKSRWRPGQSGNPGGRPKGVFSIAKAMRENLDMEVEVEVPGRKKPVRMKLGEAIVLNLQLKAAGLGGASARKADTFAATFIAERTEGKVRDVLELHAEDDKSVSDNELIAALRREARRRARIRRARGRRVPRAGGTARCLPTWSGFFLGW